MANIKDVNANKLIEKAADKLKADKLIEEPEWSNFVKTGAGRERPPQEKDWYFKRAAAVLRSVNMLGPIGVNKLRTKYGNKKRRGMQPEKFYKGSGAIIRDILKKFDKAGFTKTVQKGAHKGRIVTGKGKSFLNAVANKKSAKKKDKK